MIVLKQKSQYESRWLFDLIHEVEHAGEDPEVDELEIIEADETSEERRNSEEEIKASQFAGDVVLDGRAEALAQGRCLELIEVCTGRRELVVFALLRTPQPLYRIHPLDLANVQSLIAVQPRDFLIERLPVFVFCSDDALHPVFLFCVRPQIGPLQL